MANPLPALAAAAALLAAGPGRAQNHDLAFRLVNLSPLTIVQVHAAPIDPYEGDWSGNMLVGPPLGPDYETTLIFREGLLICDYVLVVMFSNRSYMEERVDICATRHFTIRDPR